MAASAARVGFSAKKMRATATLTMSVLDPWNVALTTARLRITLIQLLTAATSHRFTTFGY